MVVSGAAYNGSKPDLVMMAVNSQFRPSAAFAEVWLIDWRDAGLLKPFVVKPVFATLEQRLVIRKLGVLQIADRTAVRQAIDEALS